MNIPKIGIGVLIFNEKKILLGKRKNSHGAYTYAPPGGHLEFGETFEECAIREVKEETNLTISSPVFIAITNDIFINENKHYVSIFLKAIYPQDQKIENTEPHKVLSWEWFDTDLLPRNLFLPLKNLIQEKDAMFFRKSYS